jgi:hypothetical protein
VLARLLGDRMAPLPDRRASRCQNGTVARAGPWLRSSIQLFQELQIIVCDQRAPAIEKPPLESRTAGFGRLPTLTPRATTSAAAPSDRIAPEDRDSDVHVTNWQELRPTLAPCASMQTPLLARRKSDPTDLPSPNLALRARSAGRGSTPRSPRPKDRSRRHGERRERPLSGCEVAAY